jgi:hypothetical protein
MASILDSSQSSISDQQNPSPDMTEDELTQHADNQSEEEYEDEYDSEEDDASEASFPYTRDEFVAIITKFYEFLTTFCIPKTALKCPPEDGWPNLTPEATTCLNKTDFVIDLLRHLPYITEEEYGHFVTRIHYKCNVVDYSTLSPEQLSNSAIDFGVYAEIAELEPEMYEHTLLFAVGYESGGRMMLLNTKTGEMHVEMLRYQSDAIEDVDQYLDGLMQLYKTLEMVPIPGVEDLMENLEQEEEGYETKLKEDCLAQTRDEWFPSRLDARWIRHLYRKSGWPGPEYNKEEALAAIEMFRASRDDDGSDEQS